MDIFGLTTRSLKLAEVGMNQASRAAKVTAANVANSETPGYKARSVDFESAMKTALNSGMSRTNPRHLPAVFPMGTNPPAAVSREQGTLNGNNVNMEKEMTAMARTRALYGAYSNAAGKELGKLGSAVSLTVR